MSIKIESSNITLTFVNNSTNESVVKTVQKNATVADVIFLLEKEKFLSVLPKYFMWECSYNGEYKQYREKLRDLNIKSYSELVFDCHEIEEINVKIVKIGGAECDIDVPMDATVGDVIVGLINEGFLYADTPLAPTVLYSIDADGGISSGVKYDDRSKTISAYGWQNGLTLVACETYI